MASNRQHHEPLAALGPVDWDDVPRGSKTDDNDDGGQGNNELRIFVRDIFTDAQRVIDSIPSPPATTSENTATSTTSGRPRAKTEPVPSTAGEKKLPGLHTSVTSDDGTAIRKLREEWKEMKLGGENPLGISVYKLAARDGQGSWFARRSVHDTLSFERWRTAFEREFPEAIKVQAGPGSGRVRGIGADDMLEHEVVDGGAGHVSVFQLSAQFAGPTSPRDFVTLLLTSDAAPPPSSSPADGGPPLRQYMMVSKPCTHPNCPPRQGIIRGRYESVEIIREVAAPSRSPGGSFDAGQPADEKSKVAAADEQSGGSSSSSSNSNNSSGAGGGRAIEWIMVTRSDPGGSVPRFMVDKGTPAGIVGDAAKFLDWATAAEPADEESPVSTGSTAAGKVMSNDNDNTNNTNKDAGASVIHHEQTRPKQSAEPVTSTTEGASHQHTSTQEEGIPSSNGLYGIIAGAFETASSVASGLRQQLSGPLNLSVGGVGGDGYGGSNNGQDRDVDDDDDDSDSISDSESTCSSVGSFASAVEGSGEGSSAREGNSSTGSKSNHHHHHHHHHHHQDSIGWPGVGATTPTKSSSSSSKPPHHIHGPPHPQTRRPPPAPLRRTRASQSPPRRQTSRQPPQRRGGRHPRARQARARPRQSLSQTRARTAQARRKTRGGGVQGRRAEAEGDSGRG